MTKKLLIICRNRSKNGTLNKVPNWKGFWRTFQQNENHWKTLWDERIGVQEVPTESEECGLHPAEVTDTTFPDLLINPISRVQTNNCRDKTG